MMKTIAATVLATVAATVAIGFGTGLVDLTPAADATPAAVAAVPAPVAPLPAPLAAAAPVDAQAPVQAAPAPTTGQGGVNVNTATTDELVALPGIGKATAKRITDHVKQAGPFKSVDELKALPGVTDKNYALFAGQLHV